MPRKDGSLVIVGTGVRSLGQLTLETIEHIEKADRVYYSVRDAVTEGFIKGKNTNAIDVYCYDDTIPRLDIFIQIAEVWLTPPPLPRISYHTLCDNNCNLQTDFLSYSIDHDD